MRLISWNVNGIRAAIKKDFLSKLPELNPDVLCLQETKAQDDQVMTALGDDHGYQALPHSAVRPGYSGTAILSRQKPLSVDFGLDIEQHDQEGRVITAEFDDFYLVTVYTPNSGSELKRLAYREQWDRDFQKHVEQLEIKKPVIICGDLNVCHQPIDIARPDANYNKSAGYTQIEIDGISNLLKAGYIDSFRHLYPDTVKYSWWSMRGGARARNVGWRLDYFLVSEKLASRIKSAEILNDVFGSDHCPVVLEID
ncbi:exodeoxyribonuclease III [Pseudohongiella acticola]|jgi:exodeoxyribonuclease III|uniref:Exodeoxyribonuclease III n=1 Tax=Pseudohongiella acticola TaxID=1524254 RepID=A0A1E8CKP6_9GAMM|nr:exodeoxyribonuclease III [Pseudohongiella acticola]OFE12973.1 exodeoxyribonuclease III [Pseudohongiella acticola]